jgi:hypothetical protein
MMPRLCASDSDWQHWPMIFITRCGCIRPNRSIAVLMAIPSRNSIAMNRSPSRV